MGEEPKPYTCKHGCERDKLKDMILTQATEAAKAATYYVVSKSELETRIATLEADLAGAREEALPYVAAWAARYAHDQGYASDELHPLHYEAMEKLGARMDDFKARALKGDPA